jgi:hypothetical protein
MENMNLQTNPFTFSTIRHPLNLFVSKYNFGQRLQLKNPKHVNFLKRNKGEKISIDETIDNINDDFKNEMKLIYFKKDGSLIDCFLRLEFISNDLNLISGITKFMPNNLEVSFYNLSKKKTRNNLITTEDLTDKQKSKLRSLLKDEINIYDNLEKYNKKFKLEKNKITDSVFENEIQKLSAQYSEHSYCKSLYYLKNKQFKDSLINVNKCLNIQPTTLDISSIFAENYLRLGNSKKWNYWAKKCLETEKRTSRSNWHACKFLINQKDYVEAARIMINHLEFNPTRKPDLIILKKLLNLLFLNFKLKSKIKKIILDSE